jgi:hypothetical protein
LTGGTVHEVSTKPDRLVARLEGQGIEPASIEWYAVDEDRKPVARPGAQ